MRVSYPVEYCRNCDALIEAHSNLLKPRKKQTLVERRVFRCNCLLHQSNSKEYLLLGSLGEILVSGKTLTEIKKATSSSGLITQKLTLD